MRRIRRRYLFMLLALAVVSCRAAEDTAANWMQIDAIDALGRELARPELVGPPRKDRIVAMFYWTWHQQSNDPKKGSRPGPYDISKIVAKHPEAVRDLDHPAWGKRGVFHHWGEPLLGYYKSTDRWVIRKHLQMLALAGVDAIFCDTTNYFGNDPEVRTWRASAVAVMQTIRELIGAGQPCPRFGFYTITGHSSKLMMDDIYELYYREGAPYRYPDTWFNLDGRPLMIGDVDGASPKVKACFTLRRDCYAGPRPGGWPWLCYTWPPFFTKDEKGRVATAVAVGSNADARGNVSAYSYAAWYGHTMRGRNFSGHNSLMSESWPGAVNHGIHFGVQWDHVLANDPNIVFVCAWNEWIAIKFPGKSPDCPIRFHDLCTQQYSRDIEPMKGGHGDNYYLQLADYVRKLKGAAPVAMGSAPTRIKLNADFTQWEAVTPVFRDYQGDTTPRHAPGYGKLVYTNTTGRNDFVLGKVARDDRHVFFYVQTAEPITPHTDPRWMRLFIDSDGDPSNGWNGYDYVVNRSSPLSAKQAVLERSTGGWKWESAGKVDYRQEGQQLHLAIPWHALGLSEAAPELRFKWADNNLADGDVLNAYVDGDTAPDARFCYVYRTRQPHKPDLAGRHKTPVVAVKASGVDGKNWLAEHVRDGRPTTCWSTPAVDIAVPQWLELDLGGKQKVTGLRLVPRKRGRTSVAFPRDFRIQARNDTGAWTVVPGQKFSQYVAPIAPVVLDFETPVLTSALRILATKLRADDSGRSCRFQLAEVEVFGE